MRLSKGVLPPSWTATPVTGTANISGWSAFGLLLPYLENGVLFSQINFTIPYANQPNITLANGQSVQLTTVRIPVYISPGEPRDTPKLSSAGVPTNYPINYAINLGTWLVWDPSTNTGGLGAAYPNSTLKSANFTDGTFSTMGFAEVKSWGTRIQPVSGGTPAPMGDPSYVMPTSYTALCSMVGTMKNGNNHGEWSDGHSNETGFTTTFLPNQLCLCPDTTGTMPSGTMQDVDWLSANEGTGLNQSSPTYYPTYAANTARSYFPGAVNVSMMDGSVKPIANTINIGVWQAISTRASQELLPPGFTAN